MSFSRRQNSVTLRLASCRADRLYECGLWGACPVVRRWLDRSSDEDVLMSSNAAAPPMMHARVASLKILDVTFTDTLSVSVHVDDVISSSACAVLVGHSRLAVSRDVGVSAATGVPSALLSSQSSPMPLRLGGALPQYTRINLDSGHRLCHLTFLLLRICAQQLTTNILLKLLHSRTTLRAFLPPRSTASQWYDLETALISLEWRYYWVPRYWQLLAKYRPYVRYIIFLYESTVLHVIFKVSDNPISDQTAWC